MFRRLIILITGTIAGVVAVLAYQPPPLKAVAATGVSPLNSGTNSLAASKGAMAFAGKVVQSLWGPVQVEITVAQGRVIAARALQFPNGDRRTESVSQQSIPYLIQETISTKSAKLMGVSGASYTSESWRESLASARMKAGI